MAPGPRAAGLSGSWPEGAGLQQNRLRPPFFGEISQAFSGPFTTGPAVLDCGARMGLFPRARGAGPPPKKALAPVFFLRFPQPACPGVGWRGALLRFLVSRTRNFCQFFALNSFLPKFQRTWVGGWERDEGAPPFFLEFFETKELF